MPSPNTIASKKRPPPSQRKVIILINARAFIRIFMVCDPFFNALHLSISEVVQPIFYIKAISKIMIKIKDNMSRLMTKPTKWLCTQRRLRSAWASAQSDQSLCCALNRLLWTQAFFVRTAKPLIRLGGCPGWSESSLGAQPHCWFCHEAAHIREFMLQDTKIHMEKSKVNLQNKMSRLMTKPTKWHVHPAKTQISLSAWRKLGSLATYWAQSKDSDRTGQMPRLIWVFAACTCHFVGFVMRQLKS